MDRRLFLLSLLTPTVAQAGVVYHDLPVVAEKEIPEVFAYSTTGCPPCALAKKELEAAKDLPFRVVWKKEPPNWVSSFPTFHWHVKDGDWRKRDKWDGVEKLVEMWKKSREESKKTQAGGPARPFTSGVLPDQQNGRRAVARDVLAYNPSHQCQKCGRSQFDIYSDAGPNHIHRCNHCFSQWYHRDR